MNSEQQFWKPEPREPWHDWRTFSMLIPVLSSALGACLFLALGFSFTEIAAIPQRVRTGLVIVASFTVAFGSSFGSVGSGIEIFRKVSTQQAKVWDWVSLGISTATTIAGFAMGFAALLGATADWSRVAVIYGSLVVGTLAALDSSGDMIELGGLFGSFEERYETWLEEREQWRQTNGVAPSPNGGELEKMTADFEKMTARLDAMTKHSDAMTKRIDKMSWPVARLGDFEKIREEMNGHGIAMTAEQLEMELDKAQMRMPSPSTVTRWLQVDQE